MLALAHRLRSDGRNLCDIGRDEGEEGMDGETGREGGGGVRGSSRELGRKGLVRKHHQMYLLSRPPPSLIAFTNTTQNKDDM